MCRAAMSMSAKVAWSFHIDRLRRVENLSPADRIAASLDRRPRDKIDAASDDGREILIHRREVFKSPGRLRREDIEEVQIAFRREIVADKRAEDREFSDLPAPAELGN